jgi:hypothetical protein
VLCAKLVASPPVDELKHRIGAAIPSMHIVYVAQRSADDLINLTDTGIEFDSLFPEIDINNNKPLTSDQLIAALPLIWVQNEVIGTTSEVIPLWLAHQVRVRAIHHDAFTLYEVCKSVLVKHTMDEDGDFEQQWEGGFFDWRVPLLFDD